MSSAFRRIPDHLRELLYQLENPHSPRWWFGSVPSEELARLYTQAAASHCAAIIPALLTDALRRKGAEREAAFAAICRLYEGIPLGLLPVFDQFVRDSELQHEDVWRKFSPAMLAKLTSSEWFPGLLGVFSSHPSGYVREAAVKALAAEHDGREFAPLLVRMNDWVDAVAAPARAAVMARLQPACAPLLVPALPLIVRLGQARRSNHEEVLQKTLAILTAPECRGALRDGLENPDPHVARACVQLLSETGQFTERDLLEHALGSRDAVVRTLAAKGLWRFVLPAEALTLCERLLRDRSTSVRYLALAGLLAHDPAAARPPLERTLLDPSGVLRQFARTRLQREFAVNAAEHYRRAIQEHAGSPATLAIALSGLGECGRPADLEQLRPFFSSPALSLRKTAIGAAGRLAPAAVMPDLLAALQDASPGLSRAARQALVPQAGELDFAALETIRVHSPYAHTRLNALRLLLHATKWSRITFLLRATTDAEPRVAELAQTSLQTWFDRYNWSFLSPTAAQLVEARLALRLALPFLSEKREREIDALLCEWERGQRP